MSTSDAPKWQRCGDGNGDVCLKPAAPPASYRTGHYIAVRRGKGVQRCIFKNWTDANAHVQDPDAAYSSFEDITDAAAYAFAERSEDHPGSSELESLAQDVKNIVFSYIYSTKITDESNPVVHLFRTLGFASKALHQSCLGFVKYASFDLTTDFDMQDMRSVMWLARNGAKLSSCQLPGHFCPNVETQICWIILTSFDITGLRDLKLAKPKTRLIMEENNTQSDAQDHMRFRMIVSESIDTIIEAVKRGIPFEELFEASEIISKIDFAAFLSDTLAKRARFLRTMHIKKLFDDSLPPLLSSVSETLVDLKLDLWFVRGNKHDPAIFTRALENMVALERLEIKGHVMDQKPLSIRSKTLKDLSARILLEECICPALKRISLITTGTNFDPDVLVGCSNSLEEMHINFSHIDRRNRNDAFDLTLRFRSLEHIIEEMPRLKRIYIMSKYPHGWKARIKSNSVSDVTIALGKKSRINEMTCPLLKSLGVNLLSINSSCLPQLFGALEELSIFLDFDGIEPVPEFEKVQRALGVLYHAIANDMPQLKRLAFKGELRCHTEIRSDSLEVIDTLDASWGFLVTRCDCPSLKLLQCLYGYSVDQRYVHCTNGVQLTSDDWNESPLDSNNEFECKIGDLPYLQFTGVPDSCVVKFVKQNHYSYRPCME